MARILHLPRRYYLRLADQRIKNRYIRREFHSLQARNAFVQALNTSEYRIIDGWTEP